MSIFRQVLILNLYWVSLTQAQNKLYDFLLTPNGVVLGMTEVELSTTRDALFPGPTIKSEDHLYSYKTFMEIDQMGLPGHKSFYYLFENNKLQGVIKTTSLVGLEERQVKNILVTNYRRVFDRVTEKPNKSFILRKDGDRISKVTLNKWNYNQEPDLDIFYVATNNESSVGVIINGSNFPASQLFVSADDDRFIGLITDNPSIADVPFEELEKIYDQEIIRRKPRENSSFLNENNKKPKIINKSDSNALPVEEINNINYYFLYDDMWIFF